MSRRRRRKNNSNSTIIAIIVALLCIGALVLLINSGSFSGGDSGCGSREEDTNRSGYCITSKSDYDEMVIVTGNTQNTPEPNLDFTQDELYDILGGIFYNTERGDSPNISIVSASGTNQLIDYDARYKVKQNIAASNNELKKLGDELNSAIKTLPEESGADYVGGILEAGSYLKNAKNPLILVVGSGYNDSGALDFANTDILQNKNATIDYLTQSKRIRENNLDNITIYWYDIGYVVKPQADLSEYKEIIREIYKEALGYLGAKEIKFFASRKRASESIDSLYTVQQVYIDELKVGDTFDVNENIGKFYPDKDILINPSEVKEKLSSFAKRFNPTSNTKLKLTGYIAICVSQGQLGLSRAETIKGVLVELGIPADKIETHGERGSPPESPNEAYSCNSHLPEIERRTVRIEVVKD